MSDNKSDNKTLEVENYNLAIRFEAGTHGKLL